MKKNIYDDLEYWMCVFMMMCSWYSLPIFWSIGYLADNSLSKIVLCVSTAIFVLCIVRICIIQKKYSNESNK